MRTTTIKLTKINKLRLGMNEHLLQHFMFKTLLLRKAWQEGDMEIVNNYQLGKLKNAKEWGCIDFEVIK